MSSIAEENRVSEAEAAHQTPREEGGEEEEEFSLYEAIHERYLYDDNDLNESLKNFTLLFNNSDKTERSSQQSRTNSTGDSPRKLNKLNSRAIVLSEKGICCVGNSDEQVSELAQICPNLQELDLSCNKFKQWSEIRKILNTFKHLKFLNLSSNSDLCSPKEEKEDKEMDVVSIFTPNIWSSDSIGANLSTLILNRCYIDMATIERLLACLPSLDELYLAHNNYNRVEFSPEFVNSKLRALYFNNNLVEDWNEVIKLDGHFDQLETLVLSENPINGIKPISGGQQQQQQQQQQQEPTIFKNLKHLTINKLNLTDWNDLERIKNDFVALKHLKIQNIPLLNQLKTDDEKFTVLLAYFGEFIDFLNGSPVTLEERDKAERNFLRYFMEKDDQYKPPRYFELEAKHGKVNKLVEINFEKDLFVNVRIKCGDKTYYDKIDTRQTVGAFKTYLEKYANCKAALFRLFYMDYETVEAFGPDELRLMNITLGRFHLKDGDEFEIVPITPPPPPKKK